MFFVHLSEFSLILERLFSTGVLKQRVDSSQVVFEFPRNDKHGLIFQCSYGAC